MQVFVLPALLLPLGSVLALVRENAPYSPRRLASHARLTSVSGFHPVGDGR